MWEPANADAPGLDSLSKCESEQCSQLRWSLLSKPFLGPFHFFLALAPLTRALLF